MRNLSVAAGMIFLALALAGGAAGEGEPTSQPATHLDMPATWPPATTDIPRSKDEMGSDMTIRLSGGDSPQISWTIVDKPAGFQIFAFTLYYYAGNEFLGAFQTFQSNTQLGDMQFPMPPIPAAATKVYVVFRSYTIGDDLVKNDWFHEWYSRSYLHFTTAQLVKGEWKLEIWKNHPVDADIETWMTECGVSYTPSLVAVKIIN